MIYSLPLNEPMLRFNTSSGTLNDQYPGYIPTTTSAGQTTPRPEPKCTRGNFVYTKIKILKIFNKLIYTNLFK